PVADDRQLVGRAGDRRDRARPSPVGDGRGRAQPADGELVGEKVEIQRGGCSQTEPLHSVEENFDMDLRDPLQFDAAYRRLAPLALRTADRVLRDQAAAEEVVQDVFMQLWLKP